MAEKAVIVEMPSFVRQANGRFELTVKAQVTNGNANIGLPITVSSLVSNPQLVPDLVTWRTLIRDAIVSNASSQLSLTVDEVMFPDLTTIGLL